MDLLPNPNWARCSETGIEFYSRWKRHSGIALSSALTEWCAPSTLVGRLESSHNAANPQLPSKEGQLEMMWEWGRVTVGGSSTNGMHVFCIPAPPEVGRIELGCLFPVSWAAGDVRPFHVQPVTLKESYIEQNLIYRHQWQDYCVTVIAVSCCSSVSSGVVFHCVFA